MEQVEAYDYNGSSWAQASDQEITFIANTTEGMGIIWVFIYHHYQNQCHSQPPEVCGAGINLLYFDGPISLFYE